MSSITKYRTEDKPGAPNPDSETWVSTALRIALLALLTVLTTSANAAPKPSSPTTTEPKATAPPWTPTAIQKAIDTAAPKHEIVSLKPGTYLTGALFLKSGVTLNVPEGVTLTGSQDIKDFPDLPTRIAGIEMTWPAALINVRDQHDVIITGKGTIDENGAVWWQVYRDTLKVYLPRACAGPPTTTPSASASCSSRTRPTSTSEEVSPSSAPGSGPSKSCIHMT
jgi:hypothetical protein